jgi:YcaO-like protein with predicted kinase domain
VKNDPPASAAEACVLPHYGQRVSLTDAIGMAAVLGALSLCVSGASPDDGSEEEAGVEREPNTALVGRSFSRLYRDLNLLHRSDIEVYLDSVGVAAGDLAALYVERVSQREHTAQHCADVHGLWAWVAPQLLEAGVLDQLLLTTMALRWAEERRRSLGLTITEQTRRLATEACCWLNWRKNLDAVKGDAGLCGIPSDYLATMVESLAAALTYVDYRRTTRCARTITASARRCLSPRPKAGDSLVRADGSRETVDRLLASIDCLGVTRVTDITGLDRLGVPNYSVVRPDSRARNTVHSGKGATDRDALASALLEATELACAERVRHGRPPIIRAPYRDAIVDGAAFVDPRDCALPSAFAAHDFDAAREIDWIQGVDLLSGSPVWVPLEVVAMAEFEEVYNENQDSCGLGAGNSLEEAILHGLCECVERDLCKCAWFAVVEAGIPPAEVGVNVVDLSSLSSTSASLVDHALAADLRPYLVNCSLDLGVPTVWAVLLEERVTRSTGHPMDGLVANMGFGAHPNPEVAVQRALLEAIQTHTINIQGSREDLDLLGKTLTVPLRGTSDGTGPPACGWRREYAHTTMYCGRFARLVLNPLSRRVPLSALGGQVNRDVLDDIEFVLTRLADSGIRQVIYVDLRTPGIDVDVVRVVVPGLEPTGLDRTGWRCLRYLFEPSSWLGLRSNLRAYGS